jgi:hypothetical protein
VIRVNTKGSFNKATTFLAKMQRGDIYRKLNEFGQMGVDALVSATPVDTGLTASSWSYEIRQGRGKSSIAWINTNTNGEANIVILLQYGHATGTGGYVEGRDFINPTIQPVFDRIAEAVWYRVRSA